MKKHNRDRIFAMQDSMKEIIENELGESQKELDRLRVIEFDYHKKVRENDKKDEQIKSLANDRIRLIKVLEDMEEIKIHEESDTWTDDYGNRGGFWRREYLYKGDVVFEDGESF